MAELDAEHVEGHGVVAGAIGELEPGFGVDEAPDEPRRRHPVDAGPRPRHPPAPHEVPRIEGALRAPGRGARCCLRNLLHDLLQFGCPRRAEVGDGVDATPVVDEGPGRAVGGGRAGRTPRQALQQPAAARGQRPHVAPPRLSERRDDVVVAGRPGDLGQEHRGLAAEAGDFGHQPLQVLARLLAIGQHVGRLPDLHRADLLEPAPYPHPHARRAGRHLVEQHQPRRSGPCVSHETLVAH